MGKTYEGIPKSMTLQTAQLWVQPRISSRRFKHIQGVVETAGRLSLPAGADSFLAELAAWLHDACKEVKDGELVAQAQEAGLPLSVLEQAHGHLLHGPVAAITIRRELGITNQAVLDAVSQHTLGFAPMSVLSKVVFLSDCLEPGRPSDYRQPIWAALDLERSSNFDAAIVVACNLGIKHLLETNRPIHPRTLEVRNYYLATTGGAK